jgi:UrcA family protein
MTNTKTLSKFRRHAGVALVGLLALGIGAVASADNSGDVRKITVKFGDLNVSTPEGAAALYARIRSAAKTVCAPDDYAYFPFRTGVSECIQKAIADAVMKVNQPALVAVYNERNKTPLPSPLLSRNH